MNWYYKQCRCLGGKQENKNTYSCPIYKKPSRTDLNYIAAVDLKTSVSPDNWVLRGVALLCNIK